MNILLILRLKGTTKANEKPKKINRQIIANMIPNKKSGHFEVSNITGKQTQTGGHAVVVLIVKR